MNELNYASLEASKKLVDNGIVLKTDIVWADSVLKTRNNVCVTDYVIPAPSMAEVWRELPFQSYIKKLDDGSTLVWICDDDIESNMIANTNPTDALIDLLIWLKGENK
jgi:hypothetical protein